MPATPLTKARAASIRKLDFDKLPMQAGVKAFRRGLAACKAGYYGPATGDPTEVIVGTFYEDKDNSAGGAGAQKANVEFFRPRRLMLLDNDAAALLTVAQREQPCSVLDDHTATQFSPGAGSSAIVYDVTSEGVWVEFVFPSSPDDAGVPPIQRGTSTLVAGTKTITGVKLTANSQIFVTMKDPGAGVLTSFAGFAVPAASRNVGTGQFVINAIDDTKATLATAVCTFDYVIIG